MSSHVQRRRRSAFQLSLIAACAVIGFSSLTPGASAAPAGGLSLDYCIKTALANNASLKVAQEKTAESAAKVKEARTGFLPKFSATASATKLDEKPYMDMSQLSSAIGGLLGSMVKPEALNPSFASSGGSSKMYMGSDNIYNIALTVQQPIFTGFKIKNGYEAAQNGLKAVKENELRSRRELVLEVKKIFFSILQAERMVEVSDTSIIQLEGIVRDLENMRDQGMVGDPEVMNAGVQLYNIKLMKIKAENGVILVKSSLCNAMGIDWNTPVVLDFDLTEPADAGVADLPALVKKAQMEQSEIKALEYQREALKCLVRINRANYVPNIVAMGNYNFKNPNREYKEEFYNSWDVTLALKMNIFDWGEGNHKTSQAASQLRQLEEGIVQLKSGLAVLVEKNYLAVIEAYKKIDLNRQSLAKARSSYTITLDKFQVGMAKNSDLLEAQRTLTQAKIDAYNSVIGYYMAHAELEHLLDNNQQEE